MAKHVRVTTPLTERVARALRAGEEVLINGTLLVARDAAHKRIAACLQAGEKLPLDLTGEVIYYAGPSPTRPGDVIGSIGPTTSYRLDSYASTVMRRLGVRGMIGKGDRSEDVIKAMKETGCVYFAAIGGTGALLAQYVKGVETLLYPELGPEAVLRLTVQDFPVIVAIDCRGDDLYRTGPQKYAKR